MSRLRLIPIVTSQAIGIGCGVAGVKVNSNLIPPDVLGAYGVFLTLAPIGIWVIHAGLSKFTVRHWAAAPSRPALLRALVKAWARRLPWLALAGGCGAVALAPMIPGGEALVATSLFVSASFLAAASIAQCALQAEGSHWKDCATSASGSLTRTFGPPLLFVAFHGSVGALWLGFTFHALVVASVGLLALRPYWRNGDDTPAPPPIAPAFRGPMFIALAMAAWVLAGVNRWIVAWFFNDVEAGYFTLMGGAAVVLTSSTGAIFMQYFQPGFFRIGDQVPLDHRRLARRVDLVALIYTVAALGAVLGLMLAGPWLIGPLINPVYRDALRWIVPAGCFSTATVTTLFYQSLLLAGKHERACGPVGLVSAAVLVAGSIASASAGAEWFQRWLVVTPVLPWVLTRTLSRRVLLPRDAVSAPAPAR